MIPHHIISHTATNATTGSSWLPLPERDDPGPILRSGALFWWGRGAPLGRPCCREPLAGGCWCSSLAPPLYNEHTRRRGGGLRLVLRLTIAQVVMWRGRGSVGFLNVLFSCFFGGFFGVKNPRKTLKSWGVVGGQPRFFLTGVGLGTGGGGVRRTFEGLGAFQVAQQDRLHFYALQLKGGQGGKGE